MIKLFKFSWPLIAGLLLAIAFSRMALSATEVKPVYKILLNDTGITTCSNNSTNGLRCPITGFPGQDAQYGRDKTLNINANGHAGFSFTKINSTGKALTANAPVWNCVQDNVTGLLWEGKTNDGGLHDMDWVYSWYNPNNRTNGGNPGYKNRGKCVNTISCDTDAYVKAVNQAGWCGRKDWRLPTKEELFGLTSSYRSKPAIDPAYFPDTNIDVVWSSSPNASSNGYAWYVDFKFGGVYTIFNKRYGNQVRLVRGG
jgi:hypothetical protein